MSVDSYLELFTTLFGWMFYGVLWDVLTATGLIYLPFLAIVIDTWRTPAVESGSQAAAPISLRHMEVQLLGALVVVVIAAQPTPLTPLRANELSYRPPPSVADPNPPVATPVSSDSTFGAFGFDNAPASVNLPIWWYSVLSMTSGINHAIVAGMPHPSVLRDTVQTARLATIEDPLLRREIVAFHSDCYVPARSKYLRDKPDTPTIQALLASHGPGDTDWIGSHVYQETAGYYDTLRARSPVTDWPYRASRDVEYPAASPPAFGRPHCDEWWSASLNGLRQKLVASAGQTAGGLRVALRALMPGVAVGELDDALARTVLHNAPTQYSNQDFSRNNSATRQEWGYLERLLKDLGSAFSTGSKSFSFMFELTLILQAAPLVQAVVLMGIYALLPMMLLVSRFSPSVLITGTLAIFSVKFWTVLWYLALWVDQNLMQSMYPEPWLFLEMIQARPVEHTSKRLILNMVTGALYIGLPLLWSTMVAWAGAKVGGGIDSSARSFTANATGRVVLPRLLRR